MIDKPNDLLIGTTQHYTLSIDWLLYYFCVEICHLNSLQYHVSIFLKYVQINWNPGSALIMRAHLTRFRVELAEISHVFRQNNK